MHTKEETNVTLRSIVHVTATGKTPISSPEKDTYIDNLDFNANVSYVYIHVFEICVCFSVVCD